VIFKTQALKKRVEKTGRLATEFCTDLYENHLDEVSFLYEKHLSLLNETDYSLSDIERTEQRIKAHVEALVIGEGIALEICRNKAGKDPGIIYAAVRVFCRLHREDLLNEVFKCLEPSRHEWINAVVEALKQELSEEHVAMILLMNSVFNQAPL
jgi:hypothetical protein